MLSVAEAVVLGVIQGITEWMPISSKSQLMVVSMNFFGVEPQAAFSLAVFLHIGTLLAAIVFFRKDISELFGKKRQQLRFFLVALLGTAVTGLPLYFWFKSQPVSAIGLTLVIGIFLVASGILQKLSKPKAACNELSDKNGISLGLAQGFSVIPGVSRSGITTSVLLLESFSPAEAFRTSFLLSIPSVFLAEILVGLTDPVTVETATLIGIAVAAIVGYLSLDVLLRLAKRISFADFAIGFGILYLLLGLLG